jgi:hypothetical protein
MAKSFGKAAAEILAAIESADTAANVDYRITEKADEKITVTIPVFLEKSDDFIRTFLDLGHFPSGVFKTKKSKRKSLKNQLAYISYISNQGIDTYNKEELRDLLNSLDQDSTKIRDVAPFIYNALQTWNDLHPKVRTTRKLNEKIVAGYLKQRANYSHREILDMVETYGKWAVAYYAMIEAGEFKPIWFHPTSLQGLLTSNKMFPNHLEGGWKQLVIDKQIPDDYATPIKVDTGPTEEQRLEHRQKLKKYIANDLIVYGTAANNELFYQENKEEIDAMVEELKNAS